MQFLKDVEVGQTWKVVTPFGDASRVTLEFKILEKGLIQISDDPMDTRILGARVQILSIGGNAVPESSPVEFIFSHDLFYSAEQVG